MSLGLALPKCFRKYGRSGGGGGGLIVIMGLRFFWAIMVFDHSFISVVVDKKFRAARAYRGRNKDELSFSAGEEVEVLAMNTDGWWKVR